MLKVTNDRVVRARRQKAARRACTSDGTMDGARIVLSRSSGARSASSTRRTSSRISSGSRSSTTCSCSACPALTRTGWTRRKVRPTRPARVVQRARPRRTAVHRSCSPRVRSCRCERVEARPTKQLRAERQAMRACPHSGVGFIERRVASRTTPHRAGAPGLRSARRRPCTYVWGYSTWHARVHAQGSMTPSGVGSSPALGVTGSADVGPL